MPDLHAVDLRGKMPLFINEILHNRVFQVRSEKCCSSERIQEISMAQGSTISVTLFAIKINSQSKVIPREIHASIFVDDVHIGYPHHDVSELHRVMQRGVSRLAK